MLKMYQILGKEPPPKKDKNDAGSWAGNNEWE